jgi:polyketide cyclase/dehydrase/lipid transport protein
MAFDHPVERVFDFLADVRNERSWNPDALSIEKLDPGPVGPGSTFRGEFSGIGAMTIRVTGYERPRRLAISGEASRLAMDAVYELAGDERATAVVMSADVRPRGLLRAMGPVVEAVMRRQLSLRPEQLRRALMAPGG